MGFRACVAAIGLLGFGSVGANPVPYSELEELLPFSPEGWYGHHQVMEDFIRAFDVHTIVEVGSYMGMSTRHLASCLPPGGRLYAVDHWLGSEEHQDGQWAAPSIGVGQLYAQFLSNIIHARLTDVVIPIRQSSLQAAEELEVQAELIFIDASHDTQSVLEDLRAWFPHLKEGGVLVGDDWTWSSVERAARIFASEHPELVFGNNGGCYWFIKRAASSQHRQVRGRVGK